MAALKPDFQLIGAAGEFLTAGKLFKRGLQVAVTYGNAKSIDLFVSNPATARNFVVQVKTQHRKNCFPVKPSAINQGHIYVFVRLNGPSEDEEFFIVPGQDIATQPQTFFGSSARRPAVVMPAINYGPLIAYRDNWKVFENPLPDRGATVSDSPNITFDRTGGSHSLAPGRST